jgi:5,10-methylenetetrahydrofolate reductase
MASTTIDISTAIAMKKIIRRARFMNKNIAGVFVPQDLIDELASAPKGQALKKGIEIAGRMIKRIHEEQMCDGVHIMAIGKEETVPDIMAAAESL